MNQMIVKPNSARLFLAFAWDVCNLEEKIAITDWKSEVTAIQLCAATGSSEREEVDLIFRHHQISMLHESQRKYRVNVYFSQHEICTLGNQKKVNSS